MKRLMVAAGLLVLCVAGAGAQQAVTGKVAETMDSGAYTYVRVTQGESSTWVAVPKMKLKAGDKVDFEPGMVMHGFESKTLGRTFKDIVFSGGLRAAGAKHSGAAKAAKDASAKTAKAEGPDAYTVAEIYAKKLELAGKTVSVRGKVVKVNAGIMGRNWIHLQDGSGDAKEGTIDLLVTTEQEAKVGETLTATGAAAKDQDFGMGYHYSLLLEKAVLKRQP